jgi:uncharacterized sulfatase
MKPLARLLIIIASLASPSFADESRPNIIVLLADDLGWRDLACTGHQHHRTPHLDRLAREGMSFTNAHSAAPICSASRAALLTGKSPARLQYEFVPKFEAGRQQGPWPMITPDYPTELPSATATVATVMKSAGYTTAFAGKWHLNRHQGHYLGWRTGHGPESHGFSNTYNDFGAHPYGYGKSKPAPIHGDAFPDDSLTSKAVEFIRSDQERPFLLWLSFYHVHDPFHSPCVDRVASHQAKLPDNTSSKRAHYAAMVETLDHEVGRILEAIDATGKARNTLILFTSDNGGHPEVSTNGPLRGSKWNLYQGGLRVPLIVRWPAHTPPDSTCADTLIGTDIPATLLHAAGLPTTTITDGSSFLPRLKGETDSPTARDRVLTWHFPFYQPETRFAETKRGTGVEDFAISQTQPTAAIRSGNWKLIHHFEDARNELFNLSTDPSESKDLSRSDPSLTQSLRRKLLEDLSKSGARLPVPKP